MYRDSIGLGVSEVIAQEPGGISRDYVSGVLHNVEKSTAQDWERPGLSSGEKPAT